MLDLNAEVEWTTINMSPIRHVPKHGYLYVQFYFILKLKGSFKLT